MIKITKLNSYDETRSLIEEILVEEGKDTIRKRKIYLGKCLREANEYVEDQRRAWSRPLGDRWLHGEQVTKRDIKNTETEIKALEDLLEALSGAGTDLNKAEI